MSKKSSVHVTFKSTDTGTVGGGDALIDYTSQVRQLNGQALETLSEELIGYGRTYPANDLTGIKRVRDIQLTVDIDTAANTLWRILRAAQENDTILSLKINVGTTPTSAYRSFDYFVASDQDANDPGALQKGQFVLRFYDTYAQGIE